MSQKNEQLIRILKQSASHRTGKELAAELGVSPRTVINYVNRINEQRREPLILSDGTGYYINRSASDETDESDNIPQDRTQRMYYLLRLLLLSGEDGVNAFDLADELAVSYSLMKKEITGFNSFLEPYGLHIRSRSNLITVDGNEISKRKAVTAIVQKYQGNVILSMDILEACFPDGIPGKILDILQEYLDDRDVYINDFSRLNMILHLSIVVSRLRSGHSLDDSEISNVHTGNDLPAEILHKVEDTFGIRMNKTEAEQMDALIRAHIHLSAGNAQDAEDEELQSFMASVMEEVRDLYYLDLTSPAFLIPFTLHIKNLMIRLRGNINIDNPVKETFRSARPFLYDIAMYIMNAVSGHYGIHTVISDNEFTFLVMHLALELERQKQDSSNVRALLCFPKYIGIEQELRNKICLHFEDQINVVAMVHTAGEIFLYDYDILISFVRIDVPTTKRLVCISPLMTQNDYSLLNEAITEIQQEKLLQHFRNVFPVFFAKENFMISKGSYDKYEIIRIICENLKTNGCVKDGFEKLVIQREDAIPTGYINFAVPHAVSQNVMKQNVSVMIFPDGTKWDDKIIYCVMLMAVDPQALDDFQAMYNALLLILLESDGVEQFRAVKTFEEFRDVILSCRIRR